MQPECFTIDELLIDHNNKRQNTTTHKYQGATLKTVKPSGMSSTFKVRKTWNTIMNNQYNKTWSYRGCIKTVCRPPSVPEGWLIYAGKTNLNTQSWLFFVICYLARPLCILKQDRTVNPAVLEAVGTRQYQIDEWKYSGEIILPPALYPQSCGVKSNGPGSRNFMKWARCGKIQIHESYMKSERNTLSHR